MLNTLRKCFVSMALIVPLLFGIVLTVSAYASSLKLSYVSNQEPVRKHGKQVLAQTHAKKRHARHRTGPKPKTQLERTNQLENLRRENTRLRRQIDEDKASLDQNYPDEAVGKSLILSGAETSDGHAIWMDANNYGDKFIYDKSHRRFVKY